MPAILVANAKGGSGKSTLATNLAGYYARAGKQIMLGDIDRQQSARLWLGIRSPLLPTVRGWELDASRPPRPPRGTTHAVLDSPAGLHGHKLAAAVKKMDAVLVPVQPSLFDIVATRDFLLELAELRRIEAERIRVGVVGMRVDNRTHACHELERFCAGLELPVLTFLRNSQLYVQAAAHGMSIFDVSPSRGSVDQAQWQPILSWLAQR